MDDGVDMATIKASVLWDYAMRAAVPIALALSGVAIRNEIRSQEHERRISDLENDEKERRGFDRKLLDELSAIRVTLARLEERLNR